ncbi:CDP-alcohol phosphatidyltransferase family protein [Corynebacterium felinum]|uniref:Phosphatidylinositol phosphate synthase n=1 Tax=Corynebacterium felinum TaxID=131318 RepID=A0ABU2BEK8_9CORY|nr:CDP-alcohol phosphatidyltransferase family protein [Corynebacterium felinum]MDF5821380.1 CDP-alcohol phosphatidyltransferase family protein [Corynebacterium felinum]MDR7355819.1 CDP-diacylglycerol--glycerol-3-phosphate 3-phosphatidyltransferase [Corynebacterium felinum]WJY95164.1 CDP-diacylglycerol--inositol 3-phosphatidyltransferase [Corynebacterium felinum]
MLSVKGRKPAAVVMEPIARGLLRMGLSPNAVTIVGAACTIAIAVVLIPMGHLFAAAVLSGVFAAFDMVDGTMARMKGSGTKFGATLDATCDRITDGALFAAITWWLVFGVQAHGSVIAASFVVLVASQVISYVKARGEASGLTVVGGLIERPERLILGLLGVGLSGLGVPFALEVALWLLAVGSVVTVVQRLMFVARDEHAKDACAAPAGAKEHPQVESGSQR